MHYRNVEREEKISQLWKSGATIDKISLQTRIPRSTVGYYVGKLKRSGGQRLVPEPVAPSDTGALTLASLTPKIFFNHNVGRLLASEDFIRLYYFIQVYKMLMEMQSLFKFTKEETELYQKEMNLLVSQAKETIGSKPELTKKKTVYEILGLDYASGTLGFNWDDMEIRGTNRHDAARALLAYLRSIKTS